MSNKFLKVLKFNFEFKFDNRDLNKPKLQILKNKKNYTFNIYLNESRWKVVRFLENYIKFPLKLLLSDNSLKMFYENENNYYIIFESLNNDNFLEEEFKEKLGLVSSD